MVIEAIARLFLSKFGILSLASLLIIILVPPMVRKLTSVDGGYANWSGWSPCLKPCGNSIQGRVRNCTKPRPKGYGKDCLALGPYVETRPCQSKPCPVDGKLGLWSEWKECDKPCREGKRKRTRNCDSPAPQFGGKNCEGITEEEEQCHHLVPCPIDGGYSDWGQFSACSVTCGNGHKTRKRECNKPVPQFGGKNCIGPQDEVQACKDKDCETKAEVKKT